jgi:MFS transporter, Spinster family, sphingosine-1-phosphate transporter
MPPTGSPLAGAYKHYVLFVLTLVLLFNNVERVALGLLLQDIKTDLDLSDTQLGFLTGIAFSVFYATVGLPIARWADRGNRVWITTLTTLLWSVTVALCGLTRSFVQLLLVRVGVAVGEAGCVPPAFSLLADYYSRAERPRATAIYQMAGGGLSIIVGYLAAGWLNELYGWRMTFILLGLPGLLLAVLTWTTLREPRQLGSSSVRSRVVGVTQSAADHPAMVDVWRVLWKSATFRSLLFAISAQYFFNCGIGQWSSTFFIRSYGFEPRELGTWLALIAGPAGLVGAYLGGELATRYAVQDERRQLMLVSIAIACSGVLMSLAYVSSSPYFAFAMIGAVAVGLNMSNGPLFATIQTLVPERMRAVALAIIYLFANLIGMGFGPLLSGALSDGLRPWLHEESLRYALLILSPGYFVFAWYVWRASRTVARDLAVMQGEQVLNGQQEATSGAGASECAVARR